MPGFIVNGVGQGVPSSVTPYYKYTWDITQFHGENQAAVPGPLPLMYLKEASTPSWVVDREEIMGSSLVYKFAKSIKWNDIKFTWYDTLGLANKIKTWREAVWTPEDGMQSPDNYKRTSVLRSLTFAWGSPVVWTMFNSWPSNVDASSLTYTESEIKQVDVTLTYDWAEETT